MPNEVDLIDREHARLCSEAIKLRDNAASYGCKHGIDAGFWDLVVRATTAEFDAQQYALDRFASCPDGPISPPDRQVVT